MTNERITYRLAARTSGTVVFGLQIEQLAILGTGGVFALIVTVRTASTVGLIAALGAVGFCVTIAFVPWRGRPVFEAVPVVTRYALQRMRRRHQWLAPIPFIATAGTNGRRVVPPCLEGIEIVTAERPAWAGTNVGPMAFVRDGTTSTLTAIVTVRGREFALLDESDQHQRISAWGKILGQFARDSSLVSRISWYEHCTAGTMVEGPDGDSESPAAQSYRDLLAVAAPTIATHETNVAITIDFTRNSGGVGEDASVALETNLRTLITRMRDAGLAVDDPPTPRELMDIVRRHSDPFTLRSVRPSFAGGLGYVEAADALPLAVENGWDRLRVDGAWHRSFWVSSWPTLDVGPRWLEPLLLDGSASRTLCVVMEPIGTRRSRRRLNVDAVRIQGDVANRERHGLRVPFHLQRAHDDLDQRERELQSGFAEYRYLALLTVTAADRAELDVASRSVMDSASQCGIDLRALDLRHDSGWACTLPIGRAPGRGITDGVLT